MDKNANPPTNKTKYRPMVQGDNAVVNEILEARPENYRYTNQGRGYSRDHEVRNGIDPCDNDMVLFTFICSYTDQFRYSARRLFGVFFYY